MAETGEKTGSDSVILVILLTRLYVCNSTLCNICGFGRVMEWWFSFTALKHTVGPYILNGNWTNSWAGDYEGAGTVFAYRKENGNAGEAVFAPGPLTESIDLIVIWS